MALEGTLKDFALPDIFQLIGLQKKTGVLRLKDETDEVIIAFKDGLLVSADSKNRRLEERLGTRLVRSTLITEGQLHDVLEKQKQTLQRIGIVLVNEGIVRKEDLRQALEIQVKQIIYRVFRWDDGGYRFDQDAQIDYDRENFQPISAEGILMEGMRILDEWPIIEKVVRSMSAVYEKLPVNQAIVVEGAEAGDDDDDDDFDFNMGSTKPKDESDADRITLTAEEGAVYNLLDGTRTVDDVMYLGHLSDFDTCKAIYDLLNRALIKEKTSTGGSVGRGSVSSVLPQEASPIVVGSLLVVIAALTILGAVMFRLNPVNKPFPLGFAKLDVQRQDHAATATRLDHVVRALEAYRLANGDQRYPADLEELLDSGFVRRVDTSSSWGSPFDYSAVEAGQGYRLQAPDEDDQILPNLERVGGMAADAE